MATIALNSPSGVAVPSGAISFRRGENGYTGTVDTFVGRSNPNTSYAATTTLEIDTGTQSEEQALLRFDNLFGDGSGQVPPDAAITSV